MELFKCRAQVQKEGQINYSRIASDLYRMQGITGLYRGFWAFAWRDVPGWAVYFSAYQWLKEVGDSWSQSWTCSEDQKSLRHLLWTLNAGGAAGLASWAVSIPQDMIKTRQQTHLGETPLSMRETYHHIVREGGTRKMFRGMHAILLRGYVVNVVTLPLFDAINDLLRGDDEWWGSATSYIQFAVLYESLRVMILTGLWKAVWTEGDLGASHSWILRNNRDTYKFIKSWAQTATPRLTI